jgi:hypothetical protein
MNGNGTGQNAAADSSMTLLASISEIKAEIKTIDERRAALVQTLKAVRDGLKGIGRSGAARKSSTPRKPRAAKPTATT